MLTVMFIILKQCLLKREMESFMKRIAWGGSGNGNNP